MKHVIAGIFSTFFLFGIGLAAEKPEFKDRREKESYSLGFQFGKNMQYQGVDIDLDTYTAGVRDGLGGQEPQMTVEEIHSAIQDLQQRLTAARQETLKAQAEKNLAAGTTFLAENSKKDGVTTLPSGLQYKVLSEGSGKTPKASDNVTVHYRGSFIDGSEFDSSIARGQATSFQVNRVIAGWTEALQLMKEGCRWQLFIPPGLAYGERGAPPRIQPQSTLVFEVELISVN
jgi:FKBP-type peptidyl-prolyl cis-trans isomerase FklB